MPAPHVDASFGNFSLPSSYTMSAASIMAVEELTHRHIMYSSIPDTVFASLSPTKKDDILKVQLVIVKEASHLTISAAVAISSNRQFERRNVVLDHLRLTDTMKVRARTAPFLGKNLMGPDPESFNKELLKFKDQHALHSGLPSTSSVPRNQHSGLLHLSARRGWSVFQHLLSPRTRIHLPLSPFRKRETVPIGWECWSMRKL